MRAFSVGINNKTWPTYTYATMAQNCKPGTSIFKEAP